MWNYYVNPLILQKILMDYSTLKLFIAAIEIVLGLLVLTRWTRTGAYGIALWFLVIVAISPGQNLVCSVTPERDVDSAEAVHKFYPQFLHGTYAQSGFYLPSFRSMPRRRRSTPGETIP